MAHRNVRELRRFSRDRRGNIAVIFAIALIPLISFLGMAVDYSQAVRARTQMQAALDSTSLMLSRDLSTGVITSAQVNAKAQSYFSGLFSNAQAQSVSVSATYTAAGSGAGATIQVTGSGTIPTNFLQVAGYPTLGFNGTSTATWGASLLRVAMVLDNTGSMNDYNKIGNLQTAATNLVTQLSNLAVNNGDVYISVIPFEVDVNVGTSNVAASWLRWDLWDAKNYSNSSQPWNTYCSGGYWLTYAQCVGHGYTWNHTPSSSSKSQWNGCVTDRDQSYDVTATAPTSTSTYFIADQDQSCPVAAITPLSYNWSAIKTSIASMTAQGATNQTVGLLWGWLSLLQQSPLNAPAESSNNTYQHIIVLFTDGLNTEDRWYGDGSSISTQVDTRMTTLCTNIKKSGVTIYTVQIDTDGAGQSAVLPACASDTGKFFLLTQPSQIASAFAQIGVSISKLRVAR
ncbi:pilus assembly protein [Bradyrhizobium diazoefficiens]|nr:TadE/TadG family type IV pilus assembly protein [Bradyrhizobium diazoefficiens]MBR0968317.1 pilus assembly protein [Bradyrhizobium diazoefficiens]MBR0977412.1 pilus assembly protein [Bradyrhizobium diazoefficiens]MBR1007906.1 pilus assembly protein [Bradyrhizobium diazoefficiens]MBR1013477.1 pilus assembly protein [Bradyrhizobium diazoefficiens]MBR1050569.1 pilus assembly protein [Bradyrhizobium diazoefficiens]